MLIKKKISRISRLNIRIDGDTSLEIRSKMIEFDVSVFCTLIAPAILDKQPVLIPFC
jgi:hypothetical protein